MSEWIEIDSAPIGKKMFVVKAIDVCNGHTGGKPYSSDPYCVWQPEKGKFSRWPHQFAPTHYCEIPE